MGYEKLCDDLAKAGKDEVRIGSLLVDAVLTVLAELTGRPLPYNQVEIGLAVDAVWADLRAAGCDIDSELLSQRLAGVGVWLVRGGASVEPN